MDKNIALTVFCILLLFSVFIFLRSIQCQNTITIKGVNGARYVGESKLQVYRQNRLKRLRRLTNSPLVRLKAPYKETLLPEYVSIPPFFVYNPLVLTPIQDQGICGSCWAFTSSELIANRVAILTNGMIRENLSAQEVLECYKETPACEGGNPEDVLIWLANTQKLLTTNGEYPYRQFNSTIIDDEICRSFTKGIGVKKDSVRTITKWIDNDDKDDILKENILNMKRELIVNGPFYSSIAIMSDFYEYDGEGIYRPQEGTMLAGGHSVIIVGYADSGVDPAVDGKPYWLCRNVWGTDWANLSGIPGYFRIEMGSNTCGIEMRCESALPVVYPSIPQVSERVKSILQKEFGPVYFTDWGDFKKYL